VSGNGSRGRGCSLCALPVAVPGAAEVGGVAMTAVYADDELVALVDPGCPGVLLVPRSHVAGLGGMPGLAGVFLGALRRAVTAVQAAYGVAGAMIEPTASVDGAGGHVVYRVVPTVPPAARGRVSVPALAAGTVSDHLAEAFGQRFAPR
jgi:hypothetical protein